MRSTGILAAVSILVLGMWGDAAYAQMATVKEREFASRGVWEFGGNVGFNRIVPVVNDKEGDAITELSATPFVGVFIIDGLELGLNPAGIAYNSQTNATVTRLFVFGTLGYNLNTHSNVFPFLEGLAGWTSTTTSLDLPGATSTSTTTRGGFSWGGRAGVKFAVTGHALLNVGGQYLVITENPDNNTPAAAANGRYGSNEMTFTAGLTLWI